MSPPSSSTLRANLLKNLDSSTSAAKRAILAFSLPCDSSTEKQAIQQEFLSVLEALQELKTVLSLPPWETSPSRRSKTQSNGVPPLRTDIHVDPGLPSPPASGDGDSEEGSRSSTPSPEAQQEPQPAPRSPRPYNHTPSRPSEPADWLKRWIPQSRFEEDIMDPRLPDAPAPWIVGFQISLPRASAYTSHPDPNPWGSAKVAREWGRGGREQRGQWGAGFFENSRAGVSTRHQVGLEGLDGPKRARVEDVLEVYRRLDRSAERCGCEWTCCFVEVEVVPDGVGEKAVALRVVIKRRRMGRGGC